MDRELLNGILDEQEESLIRQFYENEKLREAIKKVLLAPLYFQGTIRKGRKAVPNVNWLYSAIGNTNENLGAVIRAKTEALVFIEEGFKLLSSFKKIELKGSNQSNPAR